MSRRWAPLLALIALAACGKSKSGSSDPTIPSWVIKPLDSSKMTSGPSPAATNGQPPAVQTTTTIVGRDSAIVMDPNRPRTKRPDTTSIVGRDSAIRMDSIHPRTIRPDTVKLIGRDSAIKMDSLKARTKKTTDTLSFRR